MSLGYFVVLVGFDEVWVCLEVCKGPGVVDLLVFVDDLY